MDDDPARPTTTTTTTTTVTNSNKAVSEHAAAWLRRTLVEKEGAIILREELYTAYLTECAAHDRPSTNHASFGKIFRHVYPRVVATRLGKRGQNKMHHLNVEWRHKLDLKEIRTLEALAATRSQELQQNSSALADSPESGGDQFVWVTESGFTRRLGQIGHRRRVCSRADKRKSPKLDAESHLGQGIEPPQHKDTDKEEEDEQKDQSRQLATLQNAVKKKKENEVICLSKTPRDIRRGSSGGSSPTALWASGAHFGLLVVIDQYRSFYRRETWGVSPINPASLKRSSLSYLLTTNEGYEEVSPLALSAFTMLSIASFMFGNLDTSKEFYHKARTVLSELFDHSDYDVACVLLPFASWSRFNSQSESEGRQKESYYLTLGAKICETIGAINDSAYFGHVQLLAAHQMEDAAEKLSKAQQHPPYRSQWKLTKLQRHPPTLMLIVRIGHIYGPVFQLYMSSIQGNLTSEQRADMVISLHEHLVVIGDIVRDIQNFRASTASQQMDYLCCLAIGLRTMIYALLNSPKQQESAREAVGMFITVPLPVTIYILLELSSTNYLIVNLILEILGKDSGSDYQLLRTFINIISPFAQRFYWIQAVCNYANNLLALRQ